MTTYTVECEFELTFQPAMKKSPERLQEIVADELEVEPVEITSMTVDHDIPIESGDNWIRKLLERGETRIAGTYRTTNRY